MRRVVTGEELAQLYNPDPFAMPRWRAPVYRTPFGIILVAKFARLLGWLIRLIARHPLAASVLAVAAVTWVKLGWVTLAALVLAVVVILIGWRWCWPVSFFQWVGRPARGTWRAWCYRRRWAAVMTIAGVAPWYQGRILLPILGKVTATKYVDRVYVRLVSGQSAADFADHADNLVHGFGALLCRVRTARSGAVVLEFIRRDALAALVPALHPRRPGSEGAAGGPPRGRPALAGQAPRDARADRGRNRAGKASLLWGLVRAMFPLLQGGLVRVLAADPKLMELAYGRVIFESYGSYAADPAAIAAMLDRAVADMQDRAARFAGRQRDHTPTAEDPFTVVLVDEVAFLTAYQPDRKLKERIMLALATLTTQGRALGYSVVAALQDPRKDVLTIRNLFPDRIAMRLDEPEQVDMVLGDGARDRGATCELISPDPATGAGVAFVRVESDPDPVRVRAGWVTDPDIRALADRCIPDRVEWPEVAA